MNYDRRDLPAELGRRRRDGDTGGARLRRHFAGAHLLGVARPYVADVFDGCDWFDELLLTNGDGWSQSVPATAWRLRRQPIDLAVLLPNSLRSALTARLGGCRRRVGYARLGRSLLLTDCLEPVCGEKGERKPSPTIDAYNVLAEHVGCPWPTHRMELFTTPRDEAASDSVWHQTGLHQYSEVICLNPGAAFGSAKHWPSDSFVTLAQALADRRGSGVLVLCGPAERDLARQIARRAARPGSPLPRRSAVVAGADQGVHPAV